MALFRHTRFARNSSIDKNSRVMVLMLLLCVIFLIYENAP